MKVIYKYDKNKVFTFSERVADNYVLQSGETFVEPPIGAYQPVTWNGLEWVSGSKDDFDQSVAEQQAANEKENPTELSDTDKAVAALTLQLAQNKADQDTVNAQLLLATARQTVKETA